MKRNLKNLTNSEFDILIIGGGIYGVTAAWDAVLRGFSVALIERGDFGSATSANSLKIVHGGLRYLQHADFKRMRESIRERTTLMRIAPHLVHPLPCIMPTSGHMMKGKEVMFIAMLMNDIISFDRNNIGDPQKRLPRGHVLSKKRCLEILPGLPDDNLTGAAVWYDCQMHNSDRLLLSFVLSAANAGAEMANYVETVGFLKKKNRITGVRAKDVFSGDEIDVRAKVVVNNTGAWIDKTLQLLFGNGQNNSIQLSTALNLVVNREIIPKYGAGISSRKEFKDDDAIISKRSRLFFIAPWRGYSLIGTNHLPYDGDPNEYKTSEREIESFLAEINTAYPAVQIKREEVTYFYGGFLPMDGVNSSTGDVRLSKQYVTIDHEQHDGLKGLVSIAGLKYTTARDVAEKTVNLIAGKLGKNAASFSKTTPLYGGKIERFNDFMQEAVQNRLDTASPEIMKHLVYNYGSEYPQILKYLDDDVNLGRTMPGSEQVMRAEVLHAVREEMAQTLGDVILRRTELGSAGNPGEACLREAANIMAAELGWNQAKVDDEIKAVREVYVPQA